MSALIMCIVSGIYFYYIDRFSTYFSSVKDTGNTFLRYIKLSLLSFGLFLITLLFSISIFNFWEIDFIQDGKFVSKPFESNINIYTEDVKVIGD